MRKEIDTLNYAIEVFARGFCFTRSFTHPYLAERIGKIWAVRDTPRKSGAYRREEWIAHGVTPELIDETARKHARGRFAICAIHSINESDQPLRAGFKALSYRLGKTEPVMVHQLKQLPCFEVPVEIVRVTTVDLAERVNKAARFRQILPEHLEKDSPLRQYTALIDDKPVAWVRSIDVEGATWCADMYVMPQFRRRGIARAMMCQMLSDDRTHDSKLAVLTASHTGARLYQTVGYKQIGTLMLYTPKKS